MLCDDRGCVMMKEWRVCVCVLLDDRGMLCVV